MSIKEQLLELAKTARKLVPLTIDGVGKVCVREISARQRDEIDAGRYDEQGEPVSGHRARVIVACVCNEDGTDLFTPADVGKINELPEQVFGLLFSACEKVNGVKQRDLDAALKN